MHFSPFIPYCLFAVDIVQDCKWYAGVYNAYIIISYEGYDWLISILALQIQQMGSNDQSAF